MQEGQSRAWLHSTRIARCVATGLLQVADRMRPGKRVTESREQSLLEERNQRATHV